MWRDQAAQDRPQQEDQDPLRLLLRRVAKTPDPDTIPGKKPPIPRTGSTKATLMEESSGVTGISAITRKDNSEEESLEARLETNSENIGTQKEARATTI